MAEKNVSRKNLADETEVSQTVDLLIDQLRQDIFAGLLARGAALIVLVIMAGLLAMAAFQHIPELVFNLLNRFAG